MLVVDSDGFLCWDRCIKCQEHVFSLDGSGQLVVGVRVPGRGMGMPKYEEYQTREIFTEILQLANKQQDSNCSSSYDETLPPSRPSARRRCESRIRKVRIRRVAADSGFRRRRTLFFFHAATSHLLTELAGG